MKRNIFLFFTILLLYALVMILASGNIYAAITISSNQVGNIDGYTYELKKDSGITNMTLNDDGKFNCSWSDINNVLFRIGKKFASKLSYSQLGNITINYGCNYNPNGNSYLGVYGWTINPLVEYYIIDSWGSWRPPGSNSIGTIYLDDGVYEIYQNTRLNQPSIEGTANFQQYWSVRATKRTIGTISVSQHFNAWAKKDMKLGKIYDCTLLIEGIKSNGTAEIYTNEINIRN